MNNGEKKKFLEQIKLFIKLLFSQELLIEVAQEMQAEYQDDLLRRNTAKQEKRNGYEGDPCFNES